MPVTARQPGRAGKGQVVAAVMIGVDPHKGSHTAVVTGQREVVLGQVRLRAGAVQAERMLAWAAAWPERAWAAGGARGMGYLLAQQLVAAGERVLDVQPEPGARVRLLATGATNKNGPNDARPVAIAALRPAASTQVRADDHATVLKIWAKRHRDLSRTRNQVVCRLHAVLCDLIPGSISKQIRAAAAARVLEQARPSGAVQQARHELATAVRACGTTVTGVFSAGPAIAATVIGDVRGISRFPAGTASPPITAPRGPGCPPATGSSTGCRCAGTGG